MIGADHEMDNQEKYESNNKNIELLKIQIEYIKKELKNELVRWKLSKDNNYPNHRIHYGENFKKKILALKRLYTFLISTWFEAQLMKVIYDKSSGAFTDEEQKAILEIKQIINKIKYIFNLTICKKYGVPFIGEEVNYTEKLPNERTKKQYQFILEIIEKDIDMAILVRNRLAHTQWEVQFNSRGSNAIEIELFRKYDNIQKLDMLYNNYKLYTELLERYITVRDVKMDTFQLEIDKLIERIEQNKIRIEKSNYLKYLNNLSRKKVKNEIQKRKHK